jgi:hypothetical protein
MEAIVFRKLILVRHAKEIIERKAKLQRNNADHDPSKTDTSSEASISLLAALSRSDQKITAPYQSQNEKNDHCVVVASNPKRSACTPFEINDRQSFDGTHPIHEKRYMEQHCL